MKKYLVSVMALLALTGLVLLAADIDGTWTAETQGKNGPQTQTLIITSKGGELTGKFDNGGKGGPADISEGKIEGSNVSFKVVRDFGGKQVSQAAIDRRPWSGRHDLQEEIRLVTTPLAGPLRNGRMRF
jgi:hypothetical protein